MSHVFISYEKTDKAVADKICQYLEEHGLQCWIAPRNVLAGKEWDVSIIEAIKTSGCMVLVFSSQADASRQVKREVTIADNNNVPIIPCRIKDVEPSKLAYFLTLSHWFNAFELSLENHLPQLLTTITSHVPEIPKREREAPLAKEFTNSIGMEFVLIPAGTFMMGSPTDEEDQDDDEEQHQVTISQPFYLQTTMVTQGQWQRVMGENPSYFKEGGYDCPVERVSWDDAQKFLTKLNKMEKTDNYRLPTEAEWEYACRAGSTTKWCFGDNAAKLGEYAWYDQNSERKTHPVGQKKPNAWGLHDMHGNVKEWVQDWYGEYPKGPVTDPEGPASGEYRVLRGGSWDDDAWTTRSALRVDRYIAGFRNYFLDRFGFRVARAL